MRSSCVGCVERLGEVKPFLMSAAKSGSPDVLRALDETLSTLETSLRGMRAPAASLDQHQMFLSAIRTARKATDRRIQGIAARRRARRSSSTMPR